MDSNVHVPAFILKHLNAFGSGMQNQPIEAAVTDQDVAASAQNQDWQPFLMCEDHCESNLIWAFGRCKESGRSANFEGGVRL
jgi:hypothetical protein